jgi:hypothetical protein
MEAQESVSNSPETPFDSIEGSHEYVALLTEALADARREIEQAIAAESGDLPRRKQALLLISYKLAKLDTHLRASRIILNDLRTLRRLLLNERELAEDKTAAGSI